MKFESKMCQWCWQLVPLDPSRIVSDRFGTVVLRGQDGRMHSFHRKLKENELEQQTEQIGTEERTGGGKVTEENSETETLLRFGSSAFGE